MLTAAPVFCFGVLAPVASVVAREIGAERLLLLAMFPILIGVAGRAAGSTAALFGGTILAGIGVAMANVIVPSVIKGRFGRGTGAITGLYVAALTGGAALAAGLAVPLQRSLGWQPALVLWTLPAVAAAVVLGAAVVGETESPTVHGLHGDLRALLREGLAWQVTLFMGLQSLVFYTGLAWLPSILRDSGYSARAAGLMLALYALGGIPASLTVPVLAARMGDQRLLAMGVTALEAVAICGLLFATGGAVVWVALFALGQGGAIGLALTLMVLRAPDPHRSAELSGMAQAIGYSLAAVGPLAIGALKDSSGGWDLPLAVLLVATVPLFVAGFEAGRARTVRPASGTTSR